MLPTSRSRARVPNRIPTMAVVLLAVLSTNLVVGCTGDEGGSGSKRSAVRPSSTTSSETNGRTHTVWDPSGRSSGNSNATSTITEGRRTFQQTISIEIAVG